MFDLVNAAKKTGDAIKAGTKFLACIKNVWNPTYVRQMEIATAEGKALGKANADKIELLSSKDLNEMKHQLSVEEEARKATWETEVQRAIAERIDGLNPRKQQVLTNILTKGFGFSVLNVNATDAIPDPDKIIHLLNECQDVGNEDLQTLWAKILAGEINQPGTFSKRTMTLVKLLEPDAANAFAKLASFAWYVSTEDGPNPRPWLLIWEEDFGKFAFDKDWLEPLSDIGLLAETSLSMISQPEGETTKPFYLNNAGKGVFGNFIDCGRAHTGIHWGRWRPTIIGSELLPLAPQDFNSDYFAHGIYSLNNMGVVIREAPGTIPQRPFNVQDAKQLIGSDLLAEAISLRT